MDKHITQRHADGIKLDNVSEISDKIIVFSEAHEPKDLKGWHQ